MSLLRTEDLKVYFTQKGRKVKALDGVNVALEKDYETIAAHRISTGRLGC